MYGGHNIIMYSGRKKFLDTVDTLNLGIQYLRENTRFSLDSYDKNLTVANVEVILGIIYKSGFKTNNYEMYANIHSYMASGCLFNHDGEKIHIELPAMNIDMLASMIVNSQVLKKTSGTIMLLYGSCAGYDPEFLVSEQEKYTIWKYYYELTGSHKLAYIKYVYKNFDHSNSIWDEDECKKFLNID